MELMQQIEARKKNEAAESAVVAVRFHSKTHCRSIQIYVSCEIKFLMSSNWIKSGRHKPMLFDRFFLAVVHDN